MKRYSKTKRRSCQEKNSGDKNKEYIQLPLAQIDIENMLRESIHKFAVEFALVIVKSLLEDELRERCANRYERSAERRFTETGTKARLFSEFEYGAQSWKKDRRVIVKAERE